MPPITAPRPALTLKGPFGLPRIDFSSGVAPPVVPVWWYYEVSPTVGGSAPARPKFTVTFQQPTNYRVTAVKIENRSILNSNGTFPQTITVTRTFNLDDVLIVDSDLYTCTVQNVGVDFAGAWPLLDPRAGTTNTIRFSLLAPVQPTETLRIDWTARWQS